MDFGKISVIVPVYNVEDYLENCVRSIVFQTYQNLEIILVDDGSTDNSGVMCDQLAKKYSRIIVIHKENGGLSSARNAGMDIMTGDYVAFVDSDDYIHPKTYSIALSAMINLDVEVVEFNYQKYYDFKPVQSFEKIDNYNISILTIEDYLKGFYYGFKSSFNAWSKIFKKEVIFGLKFPEGKLMEDVFFQNLYLKKIDKIGKIYNQLYYYNVRNGSIMTSKITHEYNADFEAFYDRNNWLKVKFPNLVELDINKTIRYFYNRINRILDQENDTNMYIRIALVKLVKPYYEDIMNFDSFSDEIKADFELINTNIVEFIKKHEIEYLYEKHCKKLININEVE